MLVLMPLSDVDVACGSVFLGTSTVLVVFFNCPLRGRSTLALALVLTPVATFFFFFLFFVSFPQIYKVELKKVCSCCILVLDLKRKGSKHVVQKCMYRFVSVDSKVRRLHHKTFEKLRGAWRDRCFPEPFSCFLHETSLESLKIISARCILLKCQRKDSKKVKEHRQFRGVFGRWRTAAIDRTTFHACQRCRKTAVSPFFSRLWGVI